MPLTERDYDLLSLYIDDALTPPERRAIESRLGSDAEFRAELDALRQTIALVKSLPEMVAPRDLRLTPKMAAEVLAELKAAAPVLKPRPTIIYRLTTYAAAAASLVLVLAGALTLLQPGLERGTSATVAVADVMLTEAVSTETPTLKTDEEGAANGMIAPEGTLMPYATGGFGGGTVDPMADTAMMEEEADTGMPDTFSAAPAPVVTAGEEPPTGIEELEAPGDSATFMAAASPTAVATTTLAFPGAVGRTDLTAVAVTEEADPGSRTFSMAPPATLALTPAPTEAALAEMSVMPTMTLEPAAQVIETAVADSGDDRVAQEEAQDLTERAPVTEPSSPVLGFALVIAGIALGVAALIMMMRT